jgi:hypothetical protein
MRNYKEKCVCNNEEKRCETCKFWKTDQLMHPNGTCAKIEERFFCGSGDICDDWKTKTKITEADLKNIKYYEIQDHNRILFQISVEYLTERYVQQKDVSCYEVATTTIPNFKNFIHKELIDKIVYNINKT